MIKSYYGVVHPWLCDSMGHLTTRHYVGMFDDAHPHFIAGLGVNQTQLMKQGFGFADVKSTLEYRNELLSGDLVLIRSAIVSLGTKSFIHRHEMINRENDSLAATMENVTICFDLEKRKAVPLFPEFRAAAERQLAGES